MNYIELDSDASITVRANSVAEAKLALKELKLKKKELNLKKKEINEQLRQIRFSYSQKNLKRNRLVTGGGWVGKIIRAFQKTIKSSDKHSLAGNLESYERRKQWLESALIAIEKSIIRVETYIHENS